MLSTKSLSLNKTLENVKMGVYMHRRGACSSMCSYGLFLLLSWPLPPPPHNPTPPLRSQDPRQVTHTHLGLPFTLAFTFTILAISCSPDKQWVLVWAIFYLDLLLHLPTSPGKQSTLVWAVFFFTSAFTTSISISCSPDEPWVLIWAIFFILPLCPLPTPPLPSQVVQMSYTCSS